jgi:Xaa-Pro aminopeptidase
MVLFDGGCESTSHYAGDITRTFPVSRSFDPRQKDLYKVVYDAYRASVETAAVGVEFKDVHLAASRSLIEGLIGLKLMKGNIDDALQANAHTMFFQCGLGHLMGLDVHDMENFGEEYIGYDAHQTKSTEFGLKSLRLAKALKVGHVFTIEPGVYIIPSLIDMRKSESAFTDFINYRELDKWRNVGGIRLEDDFVLRANGANILGNAMPTTADEIEKVRSAQ